MTGMNGPAGSNHKSAIRKAAKEYRSGLTALEVAKISNLITQLLLESPMYASAGVVLSYAPIRKNNEIDTTSINKKILSDGKTLVLPRMAQDGISLQLVVAESLSQLNNNYYKIPEPVGCQYVSIEDIDLVIVPMLAGDRAFNRVGYGKGYYDRLLKGYSGIACGLLYDHCLAESIPAENHDRPLDCIITENGILLPGD
jgi:5-formyltetrahydrofolate cyclo-ligase